MIGSDTFLTDSSFSVISFAPLDHTPSVDQVEVASTGNAVLSSVLEASSLEFPALSFQGQVIAIFTLNTAVFVSLGAVRNLGQEKDVQVDTGSLL